MKVSRKLKNRIVFAICCICIVFITCTFFFTRQKIKMHPIVAAYLEEISVENSSIISMGDYSHISYYLNTPEVTEEEIKEYEDTIKEDYGVEEITLEFINNMFNLSSYDEFRHYIFSILLNQKEIPDLLECRENIMNELISNAVFDINMDEVAKYSLEVVKNYESMAVLDGLSMEEYCEQELNISYDDFFDMCYAEGEREIKTYLVVGAIAGKEYEELTEESVKENYDEEGVPDVYWCYQQIENEVYSLFIQVDEEY